MSKKNRSRAVARQLLLTTVSAATLLTAREAVAATPINTSQPFYLESQVGTSVLPDFQGGTLRDDRNNVTDSNNFTVENFSTNTIDAFGHTTIFSGTFSGSGPLTIADSVGGGDVIMTGVNTYTGMTTIDSGAKLQLGNGNGVGLLAGAIADNGTIVFDGGNGSLALYATGITGSGSIAVVNGTLELNGDNIYNGTTTIESGATLGLENSGSIASSSNIVTKGTLDISGASTGVSIVSLSGSGTVALGGQNLTLTHASGIFTGSLADGGLNGGSGGSLTIGGGTETLTGVSTFTGTTTIDTGAKLQLGDGSGVGLLAGAITDNGTIVFDGGGSSFAEYVTGITGSGAVTIESGTLSLAGVNSYAGTTLIDSGATLQLGDGSGVGLLAGPITDNGAIVFDGGGSSLAVYATGITGTGSMTLDNGTLELTGTNTYTGSMTIDSGATLQLGAGGSTGSVAGSIVDNGTLLFDYSGSVTTAGSITGSGSATAVAGTTVITGSSFLGGNVTIDNGATIQWGNGNAAYLIGPGDSVVDNGSLVIDYGSSGVGGGFTISGTGGLTIKSGSLNLGGLTTYTGTTAVDTGGYLLVSGSGSIGDSSNVDVGGKFDISGSTAGTSITTLSGPGTVDLGSETLTITNGSKTFSGTIADGGIDGGTGGSLVIAGGKETLTGTSTYTGPTTIDSGATLQLGTGGSSGSVAGNIVDNGTLLFDYSGSVTTADTISGSGSVTAVAGTTVVTASSFVGGNVTIDKGATLQWGNGNAAYLIGSGDSLIDNGSLVINYGSGGVGAPFAISGTGGLTIKSGALTMGGTTTYTGTTAVDSNGYLLVSGSGSIGDSSNVDVGGTFDISYSTSGTSITTLSGPGTVDLGGETLTISHGSTTFSGTIADGGLNGGTGGSLVIAGGTEALTGANTYTGSTTIDSGATLQLGKGGSNGSVAGNIIDNGTLLFADSSLVTTPGTITGSGLATVLAGTTVVTGSSFLGGKVTIDSGATLQWGNGAAAYLVGTGNSVVDNGSLVADFGSGGIGGSLGISGSGKLTIESGSLNLGGATTYRGTTTVDSGALLLVSTTGSINASSNVDVNGTFDVSGINSTTAITTLSGSGAVDLGGRTLKITEGSTLFSGVIANGGINGGTGGSLIIAGGTEILTGANTYTGETTIDSGATLQMSKGASSGSLVGGVIDNGTLIGRGSVGATTIGSGGTIAPGNLLGTLTLTGSATFDTGSILDANVNSAGQSGAIGGSGKTIIDGGTVQVVEAPGSYSPITEYVLIETTGGVTGTFSGVSSSLSGFTASLIYGPDTVTLKLVDTAYHIAPNEFSADRVAGTLRGVGSGGIDTASGLNDRLIAYNKAGYDNGWSSGNAERNAAARWEAESDHPSNAISRAFGDVGHLFRAPAERPDRMAFAMRSARAKPR